MLCALLAGGLTLGSTALHAQEASDPVTIQDYSPSITDLSQLDESQLYVLTAVSVGNVSYLGYVSTTTNNHTCQFGQSTDRVKTNGGADAKPATGTNVTNGSVLQIVKVDDGNYAFKFYGTELYIANQDASAVSSSQGYPVHTTTKLSDATFALTVEGDVIKITSTVTEGKSDKYHLNVGGIDGGGLSLWTEGAGFRIYSVVTSEHKTQEVTYNYMYDGVEKASETFSCVIGSSLPSPTYNFPAYVSATAPDGNVTEGVTEYNIDCTLTDDFPFAVSESYDNATWYALGLHNNPYYLHDNEGADNIALGSEQTSLDASDLTTFNKSLWCFVGNPFDGFKIYNKNAGGAKILSSSTTMSGADGGSTFPIMTEESSLPEGNNTTWDITPSSNIANGFYIAQHGISSNKMNLRDNKLAYWSVSADNGSTFRVYDMQGLYEAEIAPMVSATETHPGYVGVLKSEVISNNQEAIDALAGGKGTPEQYVTLYNAVNGENSQLELTDGYYRIKCAPVRGNRNLSLDAANNRLSSATPSETDASQIWKIAATDGELYTLTAQGVAPVKGAGNAQVAYTEAGSETATTFYVKKGNVNDSRGTEGLMWFFDTTTGDINNDQRTALNVDQSNNVILLPNNWGASVWYIQKAETIDLTIGGALCGTFCYDFAVELPEGLTAFRAVSDDADAIYLESIDGGVVPAHTPVLVQAEEAKTYELTILSDAAALSETNAFEGTLLPEAIDAGVNAYILGKKETDEAPRFYLVSEDDRTMPANKAYYVANGSQTQAFRLSFDGTTTGIDSAVTTEGGETEVYYDLSGRRVLYPAKGIYVKANGQKVYLK